MIQIEKCTPHQINIDQSEVLRYLGYGRSVPDAAVLSAIEKCVAEVQPRLSPKACFDCFDLSTNPDGSLDLGFMSVSSKNLAKNLDGCEKIILFAATVGIETDRIINRFSMFSPHDAIIAQAVGAAAIEDWCNILCRRFEERERLSGQYLRPRFSPGYGDFPLDAQKRIFEVLDCSRKIGLTLTDSHLMVPSKSVTAIIGISKDNLNCTPQGCEACKNINCQYRREV